MSRKSCSDGEAGFTLIEVLVALAIVAAVLSSVGIAIATSVKGTQQIDQRLALAGTAATLLATLPARDLLKPGRQSGETAGHRWRIDVTPIGEASSGRWTPLAVTLRLQAPRGPAIEVNTVRLARAAAE